MVSRAAKARAIAEGGVVGGGTTAVMGMAATRGLKMLAAAAPRAGAVVSRALPWVGVSYVAGMGAMSGVRAYKSGLGASEIARHVGLGMIGMDTLTLEPRKGDGVRPSGMMKLGGPKPGESTIEERLKELGDRNGAGGDPEQFRKISENSRRAMERAKTPAERNAQERRALLAEAEFERRTGQHIGPTKAPGQEPKPAPVANAPVITPAPPNETFGQRMRRRAGDAVENFFFGPARQKAEDALDKERKQLEQQLKETSGRLDDEFRNRGGKGPKYDALSGERDRIQKQLSDVTKSQAAREKEELAAYRQVAAYAVGATVGIGLGKMAMSSAQKTVAVAEKGVTSLAKKAVGLVNSSKRGVIAGTIEGDKAAAAVSSAKAAMGRSPVSMGEAYGLPGFNMVHGAAAYGYSAMHPDDPAAGILRMEGAGAMAAGVLGLKFGMQARALRPVISPALSGQLQAAEKRLIREARGSGPAGVAKAKARAAVGKANVNATADVKVAGNRAGGRVDASKIDAKRPAVAAGARLGEAKAQGASRVGVAEARGKQAVTRQVKRGQEPGPYKDTWQDSKGRIYHRKDMSVRKPSKRRQRLDGAANDNAGGSGRSRKKG